MVVLDSVLLLLRRHLAGELVFPYWPPEVDSNLFPPTAQVAASAATLRVSYF